MATPPTEPVTGLAPTPRAPRLLVGALVVLLLGVHGTLAVTSLLSENPTVDEIGHLPAGLSYWQTGTFHLYHHNPPLVKLLAAAPVALSHPVTAPLYESRAWANSSQTDFGLQFALKNAPRYLDLMARGRLVIPLFGVVGGLAVFLWARRLYGDGGGILALALWATCPNILAHDRLVTTDAAAAALATLTAFLFVRWLDQPTWGRAVAVGVVLGLAELTKFSLILLYVLGPVVALAHWLAVRRALGPITGRQARRVVGQGGAIVLLSILVIDLGYGFEGVGQPLGRFEFGSKALTVPRPPGQPSPTSTNPLLDGTWRYRVNRFRGSLLDSLPCPLPRHYVLGFDEQKIETEGVPLYYLDPDAPHDDNLKGGYTVFLDGELRETGWWYYYLATLAYKLPEGTILLVGWGAWICIAGARRRPARVWADDFAVLVFPVVVLGAISLATDICLGLRYILPILPFAFVATGRVVPWVSSLGGRARRVGIGLVVLALGWNVANLALIHPHYLAYFNRASGGPSRGSEHLIDSNLDWGQDLVSLGRWLRANHPGRRVGLAYFGQVNPTLLKLNGDGQLGFDWFLPPMVGDYHSRLSVTSHLIGPARTLTPGLYAVSATVLRGLHWRFADPASQLNPELTWQADWVSGPRVYSYFERFEPVARIGESIFVYDLSAEDCARWAREFSATSRQKAR